jgi:hypothetical protein
MTREARSTMDTENSQPTEEELKKARIKKSQRDWYLRNRHWLLEERAQKRAEASKGRRKRPKAKKRPRRTKARLQAAREASLASLERYRQIQMQQAAEWRELGWIVAKMNIQAKLSQERIYELLGGLATKKKIAEWCARAKKAGKLKPPR